MSYLTLTEALARKRVVILREYPVNTLTQLAVTYLFFAGIFFGGQAVAGAAITDSLPGIIVGFFVWTMAINSFAGAARSIMQEAQWGTLEQLYMSPYGFERVMAANAVVRLVESFAWGAAILVAMLATTGQSLSLDVLTVVPLVVLTVASALGIGFVFAGLALVYKRIDNIFGLLNFGLVFLIAAPTDEYPLFAVLPLSQGSTLLQRAMTDGVALWNLPAVDLVILVATAVGYLGAGVVAFRFAERRARRDGLLGQY
ncbi:ABC transporter permease [Halorubellus sp. PRR65]|uniref:ABC transporter permease n=1 Tax=Halorubellus sp. PRR65 TaxID=3098148 RepID=UPI002B26325D|nr:ABC transporter permease [Halorubellus sp. PRR65]